MCQTECSSLSFDLANRSRKLAHKQRMQLEKLTMCVSLALHESLSLRAVGETLIHRKGTSREQGSAGSRTGCERQGTRIKPLAKSIGAGVGWYRMSGRRVAATGGAARGIVCGILHPASPITPPRTIVGHFSSASNCQTGLTWPGRGCVWCRADEGGAKPPGRRQAHQNGVAHARAPSSNSSAHAQCSNVASARTSQTQLRLVHPSLATETRTSSK